MTHGMEIFLNYVCPSAGVVMSTLLYAAPVKDLREALKNGRLGVLNPKPWTVMTGNTLGWTAYGYYTRDPFIVASNIPGLVLSVWLNMGAAKLQYVAYRDQHHAVDPPDHSLLFQEESTEDPPTTAADTVEEEREQNDPAPVAATLDQSNNPMPISMNESLVMVPQESLLLKIIIFWITVLIWVGWVMQPGREAKIVGILVNLNLVFFYGAPLQTMKTVIEDKCSDTIHAPTMMMNWVNTSFWIAYGYAQHDFIILVPNAIGLCLGLVQGVLCLLYPRKSMNNMSIVDTQPLLQDEEAGRPTETSRSAEISFV